MVGSTALAVREVSKTFGSQRVLDQVTLEVAAGSVHALLGENGSGKSTLIKILAGVYTADPGGSVEVDAEPLEPSSPTASHAAGLRFVHQHLAVIPQFNAVENIALELGYTRPYRIDWKAQAKEARELLARLNVEMDIWRPLADCKAVERSAVAIARSIATHRGRVGTVVLDEPTSSLPEPEVQQLFRVIRELTAGGVAVIYVTHHLAEVFEIADTVSVLRDGRLQGTIEREKLTRPKLIEMIVGRAVAETYEAQVADEESVAREPVLEVRGLDAGRFEDLSFELRAGEVLGIVGLSGSGREDVSRALVGGVPSSAGSVAVGGETVNPLTPARALAKGIVLGVSNTQDGSAIKGFAVRENVTLSSLRRYHAPFAPVSRGRERGDTARWISSLDVRPVDGERDYGLLSGGNQQKVIMAKSLNADPAVLILDDPTAGVDIGARQVLYELIGQEAKKGLGVVVVSNDLEDVIRTCHRVLVMRHGSVVAELRGELDEARLLSISAHGAAGESAEVGG